MPIFPPSCLCSGSGTCALCCAVAWAIHSGAVDPANPSRVRQRHEHTDSTRAGKGGVFGGARGTVPNDGNTCIVTHGDKVRATLIRKKKALDKAREKARKACARQKARRDEARAKRNPAAH